MPKILSAATQATSQAQAIGARLGDNGAALRAFDGTMRTTLADLCTAAGARVIRGEGSRCDCRRYDFPDGSAIVEVPGAWDYASEAPGCDGWCWAGNHSHPCPLCRCADCRADAPAARHRAPEGVTR